jgi:hypothetical protein
MSCKHIKDAKRALNWATHLEEQLRTAGIGASGRRSSHAVVAERAERTRICSKVARSCDGPWR